MTSIRSGASLAPAWAACARRSPTATCRRSRSRSWAARYFVADGHHRVALARELRAEFVDAEVTRLQTNYYSELLELVKAHGYDLSLRRDSLQSREDVAADWHDHVYRPGVEAVQRESLPEMYAYKTDTDLFLWVYQRRRAHRGRHEPEGGEHRS